MIRIRTIRPALAIAATALLLTTASGVLLAAPRRHTRLLKSEPAANDTLAASPKVIKLWFSEKVELAVTSVKLADGNGKAIAIAKPARPDTGSAAPVIVALKQPLAPGGYKITWITAAKDGHRANGTIAFAVKPAR